jgi:hypothetical protein
MKKYVIAAAFAAFSIASPAMADIVTVDASAIQGANVLFNQGTQTSTQVFGNTNLGNNTLRFTGSTLGGGNVIAANGGQARVEGANNLLLTQVQFGLIDFATFNNLEFNIFGGTASSVSFAITDNGGQVFNFANLALTNGENFFGFQGINNQTIANVSATLNGGGVQDFRQIRLDGFAAASAVPEPGTWAMMLVGFGAVGYSMRRRKAVSHRTQAA